MKRALVLVTLVACGKGGDANHFGNWKPDATKSALQGAWVSDNPRNGVNKAAYEISGDTVKIWDGTAEKQYQLVVESPCQVGFKEPDGTEFFMGTVMKDGKLAWGGGNAGQRTGDNAIMCAGLELWTVEKGKCWEQSLSKRWKEAEGKCGFRKGADGEEFFWTWGSKEEHAKMDGDTLWEFKDSQAQKVADYAAAKAALEKK